MNTQDDLFQRLRDETSAQHREVEALAPNLGKDVTLASYRAFLAAMWGFHAPMEARFAELPGLSAVLPDLAQRQKAPLLGEDLAALDEGATAHPRCQRLPALSGVNDALGALYVLEGSTLGGQYVHRQLEANLPEVLARAHGFLTCYGTRTGAMWTSFRKSVSAHVSHAEHDQVVHAARATFEAMKAWLPVAVSAAMQT